MICFSKLNNLINGFEIQKLLDFAVHYSQHTGEELTEKKRSANLLNLIFTRLPEGSVKVSGSFHQFANGGKLNNDRFTIERFRQVSDQLNQYISHDDDVNVLEFGVNILTPFDPTEFIRHLISHLKTQFNKIIITNEASAEVRYTHYTIKIYNKGLQQPVGKYILRIEIHYSRMQKLFPDGLKWSQLADLKTWEYLGEVLKGKFDDVIYYDPSINLDQVPEKERLIIEKGHNPIYWQNNKSVHAYRDRKQFQDLIRKHGTKFNSLSDLIEDEVSVLVKSYHYSEEANREGELSEMVKSYHYSTPEDPTIKKTNSDPLVKSYTLLSCTNSPTHINTNDGRFCEVTKVDISMQKENSHLLSNAGLKCLQNNDPQKYNEIKRRYLPRRGVSGKHTRYETDKISHIAKQIRNEFHNSLRHKNKISNGQLICF